MPILAAADDLTLAVLYFDSAPGGIVKESDADSLSLALTETAISDLSRLQVLTLIDRENLNRIIEEQKLGLSGFLDESSTARIGELLGARYLLTGKLLFAGATATLSGRITSVESGQILAAETRTGPARELFTLQEELLEELMAQWDIPLSRKEWERLAKRDGIVLEGLIQLGRALDASDRGDYQGALTYLAKAVELNPDFSLAADLKADIGRRFDSFLSRRDQDLPEEILAVIDVLAQGTDPQAEHNFSRMYLAYLQPLIMGVSYYGSLFSMQGDYRQTYFDDYIKGQWSQMGLTREPVSMEEMERVLGQKLYKAQGILEYLLEKDLPKEGFSSYLHPVEGGLGYFLTLFATISSSPDWAFPPMIDGNGKVVMTREQYYPLLLSYCDMFLTNFPYSTYNAMVTPMTQVLIELTR